MDLNKAVETLKFDTRMKDWMMKQGMATKEDIENNLKSLPDIKEQCEGVTLEDRDID